MKKKLIISCLLVFILIPCSCDNQSTVLPSVTSGVHSDTVTDNTTDAVIEPPKVLSNEEMMKYGYDKDGYLTL